MYVVIDTNVIVSAFLFSKQELATVLVLEALYSGKIKIVYSDEIIAEYEDVLNRDKFKLDKDDIEKFIGFVVYKGIKKESKNTGVILIDAKDQPFYDLKNVLADTILVTGNIKHFPNDKLIMSPKDFINNYIKFYE